MARSCLFCRGRANTKEHAWPKWVLNLFGRRTIEWRRGKLEVKRWHGPDASVTAKQLCRGCNTGWLSELEKETARFLRPIIYGDRTTLNVEQQLKLSAWLTKTAMVFDSIRTNGSPFFSHNDCRHLLENLTPPLCVTNICLATYAGKYSIFTRPIDLTAKTNDGSAKGNAFTIAIGCFVGQVISVRYEEKPITVYDQSPRSNSHVEIHRSIVPVSWPPPISLDDRSNSLDAFANRLVQNTPP